MMEDVQPVNFRAWSDADWSELESDLDSQKLHFYHIKCQCPHSCCSQTCRCWAAQSWLSFSNTSAVLAIPCPSPDQLDEGDRTFMPSRVPRWCSLLFIPRAFAVCLCTFMLMFAIYLFVYVKLNFLVFSSSFISCSYFT